jgi:hypothetical protein
MYLDFPSPPVITDVPKRRNEGKILHIIATVVAWSSLGAGGSGVKIGNSTCIASYFPKWRKEFSAMYEVQHMCIITSTILDCIGAVTEGFTWNLSILKYLKNAFV